LDIQADEEFLRRLEMSFDISIEPHWVRFDEE
jgi:hypothetical protein